METKRTYKGTAQAGLLLSNFPLVLTTPGAEGWEIPVGGAHTLIKKQTNKH